MNHTVDQAVGHLTSTPLRRSGERTSPPTSYALSVESELSPIRENEHTPSLKGSSSNCTPDSVVQLKKGRRESRMRQISSCRSLLSAFSNASSPFCRICHETDMKEKLISPCRCSGTMGLLHRSCIEKWLGASNTDKCEICNFTYLTMRKPLPFAEWLRTPARPNDRRNLMGDLACFLLLSPLAAVSAWLCISGALHYSNFEANRWEAAGLITLSVFLVVIYLVWCLIAFRYHLRVYMEWRSNNQSVEVIGISVNESSTSMTHNNSSLANVAVRPLESSCSQIWLRPTCSSPIPPGTSLSDSMLFHSLNPCQNNTTFTRLIRETYV